MTTARRDLLLICLGTAVSQTGSALTMLSLALHLRSHGPVMVAAVLIVGLLPVALGAPVVGWAVDRWPNRRILIGAQLVQAVLTLGVVAAVDDLGVALPLLLLIGCANAMTMPAASALLPQVTGPDDAHRGYSWLSAARSTGFLVGASLAGVLVAGPGVRASLLIDATSFAVLAGLLLFVRGERDPRRESAESDAEWRGSAIAGIRYVRRDPVLLASVIGVGIAILVGVLDNVANVYLVTDTLKASEVAFGLIAALWDVGMIVGAWAAGRIRGELALVVGLPLASGAMGLSFVGSAVAPNVSVVAAAFLVGGFSNGVGNVLWQSLTRLRSPEALRGRVFAATSAILMTANVAGTLLAGPVVAGLGPRWSFGAAGLLTVLASLGTLVVGYRVIAMERAGQRVVSAAVS